MSVLGLLRTFLRRLSEPRAKGLLATGSQAPDFDVQDHRGVRHRSSDYRGRRFVLWFYPKADTPGCTQEGCGFRDRALDYDARGIAVLGISFDGPAENRAFAEKHGYTFPLLCDTTRAVGLAYGACDAASDAYARRYTYVVGPDGRIEQAIDTKDPKGQAAALLRTLGVAGLKA